ncbi:hypothetical protein L249_3462 [Ophiocordyceps polyrhachis-furcata BCC 54312]|uniref:Cyclic nucleotide-binding domain-containing protein n=1 Tax=Ophiocordyceps polyrhachis-furcata BCC 54312 TaxID=1330021 RepID=A0A367LLW2_9HYPO|nr:hypothetical protein L249_3462 [Ophiocordyceps polyrhachis-furcata BCC 54312]
MSSVRAPPSLPPDDVGPFDDDEEDDASLPPASARRLSSSAGSTKGFREPIRSYIHASARQLLVPVDSEQNARTVREDTAELATYFLSDASVRRRPSFMQRKRASSLDLFRPILDAGAERMEQHLSPENTIVEVPESTGSEREHAAGPSLLSNLLKRSSFVPEAPVADEPRRGTPKHPLMRSEPGSRVNVPTEETPLLDDEAFPDSFGDTPDIEGQKLPLAKTWFGKFTGRSRGVSHRALDAITVVFNPRRWDRSQIWRSAIVGPASCLPAVIVGLLLNILDALSYGMILFPLGKPLFAHLGPAGLSIYYVSTIVSQVVFSSGSAFRGAIGSELIEVVPFFHNMALKIMDSVGPENADAVIATTIVAYALSSMMTGLVFFLMGKFKFGSLVGFIPRHILIGCIGGVGWFLVATGFEVSARLDGSLDYNLDTLIRLTQADTVSLWIPPLVLAIVLFYGQSRVRSKYFLPLYIIAIPLIFYFFVLSIDGIKVENLRDNGWIFQGPPPDEPWWYFYTLYRFDLVRWGAVAEVIPAMLALTFFGILHVPINVPALALNCGEDNADLDRELKLHGYSNFLSGCLGSIQNYLVYANTVFFIRSGGDRRLAGFMLALLTFGVMMIGPSIIGFIPVMMVATLIFDLGFELLLEAIWLPRKKLKLAEYLTVVVIVLIMGIYDFVIGIGVGILLAFVSLIIQTSRVSAIRGTYGGDTVTSMVRRNPSHHQYLHQVGRQIYIIKLTGYLFFGTVVSVEEEIRGILDDKAFAEKPIKFLILDMCHVTGLDYSAGEAFNTISRLLHVKSVFLVLSGVHAESQLGRDLRAVGLGMDDIEVLMLPTLNSALESCENELLKTLYAGQHELNVKRKTATANLDVPAGPATPAASPFDPHLSSPRRNHLACAARETLTSAEVERPQRWQSFKEPLRLMLQVFQGLSDKNEDFWFPARSYFKRQEYVAGTVLFRRGEAANGFYLVESGILRAEYDLPQGWLYESIVAGTTCGELPFFSETERTATVQVDRDCVVWVMDREGWLKLQEDKPEVARELLKMSLKLTSERMSAVTSHILAMATVSRSLRIEALKQSIPGSAVVDKGNTSRHHRHRLILARKMRSILGESSRVRKTRRPTQTRRSTLSPRKDARREHEAPFQDRLADLGATRLLAEELTLRDVVQAMRYIRSRMFSPMPEKGLHSTRVADVLNYRAAMPAVVTLDHLNAVLPSATQTERELAELVGKGVVRKVRVERRGGMGEVVIETRELEGLIRGSDASLEAAEALVAFLRRNPTSQTLAEGVLGRDQTDDLLRAGFLTSATVGSSSGSSRLNARPEDRTTLTSVERVSRFASGTVSAVGGQQAVHLAGGGGGAPALTTTTATTTTTTTTTTTLLRLSLPGLGRYLKLGSEAVDWLREALGKTRWGEGPESWLKERFEAGGLTGMRWREFRGVDWEWMVGLAVGLGVVEVFETGAVGRGVRALG